MRVQCGKVDLDKVKSFKVKEQLVDYLQSADCPALRHLEARYFVAQQ